MSNLEQVCLAGPGPGGVCLFNIAQDSEDQQCTVAPVKSRWSLPMSATSKSSRLSTGVSGFDDVSLRGSQNRPAYLVGCEPSTQKATLGEEIISDGRQRDVVCSNVTVRRSKSPI